MGVCFWGNEFPGSVPNHLPRPPKGAGWRESKRTRPLRAGSGRSLKGGGAENGAEKGGGAWDYKMSVCGNHRWFFGCCTRWFEAVRGSGVFVVEVIVEARSSTCGLFVVRAFCVGETACVWSRRGVRRRPWKRACRRTEGEPAASRAYRERVRVCRGDTCRQDTRQPTEPREVPFSLFLFFWVCVCVCREASSEK